MVAYGFSAKRVPLTQPLVHGIALRSAREDSRRGGSIYPEFKAALRIAANGPVKFYVGIRSPVLTAKRGASKSDRADFLLRNFDMHQNGGSRIEVAAVGISPEEAREITTPTVG